MQSELLQNYINSNVQSPKAPEKSSGGEFLLQKNITQPSAPTPTKQDTFESENKKSKKGKIAKAAFLSAVIFSGIVGVLSAAKFKGKLIPNAEKTFNNIKTFFTTTGKKTTEAVKKNGEEITKKTQTITNKYQKGLNNITNAKDAIVKKVLSKVPGYKKFDEATSNLYRKFVSKTMIKSYGKAQNAYISADKAILGAAEEMKFEKLGRLKELLAKRESAITDFTSAKSFTKRMNEVDKSMTNIVDEGIETIKSLKSGGKAKAKKLLTTSIAEEGLTKSDKLHSKLIGDFTKQGLTTEEAKELDSLIGQIQNKAVSGKIKKANKALQKAYTKETNDMFGKLRDINFGCAPTDILSIAGTVGLMGIYTAQADTKEERVKVSLTTGVPLIVTLATTLYSTTKMIEGFKGLAFGAVTGFAANLIGNKINKAYQKRHDIKETPNTIVTFDDYIEKGKEKINKIKTATT